MKLKDIMTKGVEVVRPDSTIQEAAKKMKSLDVGSLPVSENEKLVGMLTDRDITIRAVAEGLDPKQTKVKDVMTPEVITSTEDQDVKEAAELMQSKQIRRVPVVDREKRLVGMVSLGDLAETGDETTAGKTLEEVSTPSRPKR